MRVLVTGVAGFIGMHVALRLLADGHHVLGLDNLNDYYDPVLKQARLTELASSAGARQGRWHFETIEIAQEGAVAGWMDRHGPVDRVVHLAAQAGVRYSLTHPQAYAAANLTGFVQVLEACRHAGVAHLVYASSSSVYGGNRKMPFAETDPVDHPVSLYAATKKANELMAHTYSHLYGLPTTGLRFFTVYGPWGRPDMAPFLFARAILAGEPIKVFNHGDMKRDFTYIDDIVEGVVRCLARAPEPDPAAALQPPDASRSQAPWRVFNIGNSEPVALLDFISTLERALGRTAVRHLLPMQPGDVPATFADTRALADWIGFAPHTPLEEGVGRFAWWYQAWQLRRTAPMPP
jgi:UDP-glucuronate 4-epimerase